jgi:hypothetical protein
LSYNYLPNGVVVFNERPAPSATPYDNDVRTELIVLDWLAFPVIVKANKHFQFEWSTLAKLNLFVHTLIEYHQSVQKFYKEIVRSTIAQMLKVNFLYIQAKFLFFPHPLNVFANEQSHGVTAVFNVELFSFNR